MSLLLHEFVSMKALLRSTYTRKWNLTQCVKQFIEMLKKIIYAYDIKNNNVIKIIHNIGCLILRISLLSRHWSCIYWDSSAWINLQRIKIAKYHTLLSFLHLMIFHLIFNARNHLTMCEMKEPSKKWRNHPSSLTKDYRLQVLSYTYGLKSWSSPKENHCCFI